MTIKRHEGPFWDNGIIIYFDYGSGYMSIRICKNEKNCTNKMHL